MYATGNPKNGKELRQFLAEGREVFAFNPTFPEWGTRDGTDVIEMPQNPKPHRFYVRVRIENGRITKVLK